MGTTRDERVDAEVRRRLVDVLTDAGGIRPAPADDPPRLDAGAADEAPTRTQSWASGPDSAPPAAGMRSEQPGPTALRSALGAFDPGRRGVRALAIVAAVVVLAAGFLAWRSTPHADAVVARPTIASVTPSPSGTGVVVAVAGRVRHPGLVRLPAGARVADALDAAGGALPDTDLSFLNLARKVTDGELILVGVTPPPDAGADGGGNGSAAGLVNLNTATLTQLDALPGIGPSLAQRILDYRHEHGPFHSIDDLRHVEGIGDAKFAEIKDRVTV